MKILYTITKSEIGGAQVHLAQLAKYMKDSGHTVFVMANPGGWLEKETTKIGVRFYGNPYFSNSFNPIRILKSFITVKKIVRDFKPDIVHCHSSFAGSVTRVAVMGRVPTIFTAHSWAFTDGVSLFRKVIALTAERFVSRWTNKIICVSEYDRQLALKYKIAPQEKFQTILNGVEKNIYTDFIKEDILITNGRLAYPKEYFLLLNAYKLSDTHLKLEIIGDGPDRLIIEEKIRVLGLTEKVILLGSISREAVQEKLSKAKIFIFISKHEGFPLAVLEAMSTGIPVIASNVGGIPEQIDSFCGVLVKNKIEEVSEAIKFVSGENVAMKMGQEAKKKFEKLFTLEKFFKETEQVYLDLVSKNNLNSFEDNSDI